jgi:hypothetical protein
MIKQQWKAPKHIPAGYEWIIVEDAKTIFRGYMRKIGGRK